MGDAADKKLYLTYCGRIIDHLGIQMYQSPVAAVAELIANAWDADATEVKIELPQDPAGLIKISDNGYGMTFDECNERYLNVGMGRRGDEAKTKTPHLGRPVLGRKGIGKFAGFGIANVIEVETVSRDTGEKTVFKLQLDALRGEKYVTEHREVELVTYDEQNKDRGDKEHGTVLRLKELSLERALSPANFARSMARRFLLHQTAADFRILINDAPLPDSFDYSGIEFDFPKDYSDDEKPKDMKVEEDVWGIESVDGKKIRWRIMFQQEPIEDEELRGISVLCNGKMAQAPFFFQLSGGLPGQFGQQYITGQVEAAFLDELNVDLIAPERQRVQWDNEGAKPLLEWGKARVQELLRLWQGRRGRKRREELESKVEPFAERLNVLKRSEKKTIRRALERLAGIPTINKKQFAELADATMTAWESGRLRDLISDLSEVKSLDSDKLIDILVETNVLTALHVAEAVRAKLEIIADLKRRIQEEEHENPLRNHIGDNPWLLGSTLETYKREKSIPKFVEEAAIEAGLNKVEYKGRLDLALTSGRTLAILEFMRPGLRLDWDHISRCNRYVTIIRKHVEASTDGRWAVVYGWIVADECDRSPDVMEETKRLSMNGIYVLDWEEMLGKAIAQWKGFLDVLAERGKDDPRLKTLLG